MKHPEIIVQIPEPCHEDWNKMTPTEKGKFCKVCTKEVVDFSARSDEEIINYLTKYKNLCGRFHTSQLDRKLIADRKKRNHWLSYAASLLLPLALFSQEKSQKTGEVSKIEKVNNSTFKSLNISSLERKTKIKSREKLDSITISGTIKDYENIPLSAATILIKETGESKMADFDGNFSIRMKVENTLVISYVGFETKEIKITASKSVYDIKLNNKAPLEEVTVIAGGISVHNTLSGVAGMPSTVIIDDKKEARKERRAKRREARAKRRAERKAKREASNK
ncbi:carboxypeptidase-like regulatory domain-containing protein [Kordia sp.]|uniref:carboxypeptidase-like regulatory domain-containing protein n=1 Tax=Kordia sp. TaxID=1965332 RepID=UPI003B5A8C6B